MIAKQQLVTVEDFQDMPDVPGKILELVDGEVIEMPGANDMHMEIMLLLFRLLDRFAEEHDLGIVRPDGLAYVLHRDPDVVRVPDISFVAWERVPDVANTFREGPPDLAVEVVSPTDRATAMHRRVQDYLTSGTRQVWVLWPSQRAVTVYEAGGHARELGAEARLDGDDVLPGFSVRVGDLFEVRRRR